MSRWLRSLLNRGDRRGSSSSEGAGEAAPVIDLHVIEGSDAGQCFTVDGDEVLIGRDLASAAARMGTPIRGVILHDPTVSAEQARLVRRAGGFAIEGLAATTNPTTVDGTPAAGQLLRPGARIRMGRTLMEVRDRQGIALSGLTQAFAGLPGTAKIEAPRTDWRGARAPTEELRIPQLDPAHREVTKTESDTETTEFRTVVTHVGELVVEAGADLVAERRYLLWPATLEIGRSKECGLCVSDMGVSRKHAEIRWNGSSFVLHHLSRTNPTLVNGCEVLDEEQLRHGDVIQIADRVRFRLEYVGVKDDESTVPPDAPSRSGRRAGPSSSLRQRMEEKVQRDQDIEHEYSVHGTFLDVDVVNSYGMKAASDRPEHIIVSFERFRAYVGEIVDEFDGHVLNSNGDELMCYFESALAAVRAGSEVLARLEKFNEQSNLLPLPFQFRVGVHTGRSLVDLDQGVAYSEVLDIAGHLQKEAATNEMLISEVCLAELPEGLPFEQASVLEREQLTCFRLVGQLD